MTVVEAIKNYLTASSSDVFLRRELAGLGSVRQVSRALCNLLEEGVLVRLGVGVYARAKLSTLSGRPIPIRPLTVLVPDVLQKLGIEAYPSQAVRDSNEGRTNQVPRDNVINTGTRRIARRLSFGKQTIKYERSSTIEKASNTLSVKSLTDIAKMAADGTLEAYLAEHGIPDFKDEKSGRKPRKFGERAPFDRSTFDYDAYIAEIERQLKADKGR